MGNFYNLYKIMADGTLRSLTILVVDDDEAVRELLGWMLEDAGHVVHTAGDGREALDFLRTNGLVDVVLSDINMPCMDGMELRRQVSAAWPGLPILLTSGRPPPVEVHHFLPKPFRWDALTSAIRTLLPPGKPASALRTG